MSGKEVVRIRVMQLPVVSVVEPCRLPGEMVIRKIDVFRELGMETIMDKL